VHFVLRHELLLFEALREGLEEEMERDPTVCVMGEDVGHYGGSYKVTRNLAEKFGDLRVLDTPIAENAFTGMGIGAAMTGLRPIIEGMNMGFLLLAFNQISNNCAMLPYMSEDSLKYRSSFVVPVESDGNLDQNTHSG
jgi:pyruvate dehydrogenase E1 component beta subunit